MTLQATEGRTGTRHAGLQRDAYEHLLLHLSRNGAYADRERELLVLERAEGVRVYDTRGRAYIDALSCLFCAQIGYSYGDEMAAAAAEQLRQLPFNTNWNTAHPAAIDLAARLADLAPAGLNQVFFTGGGSESVEAAWKLARQYHLAHGEPQRRRAEDGDDDARFCQRLLSELEAAILQAGPDTVALIAAEPIQNGGGCFTPPDGYWPGLREVADRYGILLLADEVISAFGRLGEYFGCDRYDAHPDLISLAKGLTSSYAPMGAVMVGDRICEALHRPGVTLAHGITFGGHPLSAAIALRNLEIFERDGVLENVRALEPHLRSGLEELRAVPIVGDVRGDGFFWAIELVGPDQGRLAEHVREDLVRGFLPTRMREMGLIARADDRGDAVVQIAPPLISDRETLDAIVERLGELLTEASARVPASTDA